MNLNNIHYNYFAAVNPYCGTKLIPGWITAKFVCCTISQNTKVDCTRKLKNSKQNTIFDFYGATTIKYYFVNYLIQMWFTSVPSPISASLNEHWKSTSIIRLHNRPHWMATNNKELLDKKYHNCMLVRFSISFLVYYILNFMFFDLLFTFALKIFFDSFTFFFIFLLFFIFWRYIGNETLQMLLKYMNCNGRITRIYSRRWINFCVVQIFLLNDNFVISLFCLIFITLLKIILTNLNIPRLFFILDILLFYFLHKSTLRLCILILVLVAVYFLTDIEELLLLNITFYQILNYFLIIFNFVFVSTSLIIIISLCNG